MSDSNIGGQNLGTAQGRIRIDTSGIQSAANEVRAGALDIERSFGRIGQGQGARGIADLTSSVRGLGAAVGITFGAQTVNQIGRFLVESDRAATAYRRQMVAARGLAGSQSELNDLLLVYGRATGGIVDDAAALSNVLRLQAVGFADNAEELDKFARAIRGISVAMGLSQESVTQQLSLELFTRRGARLDQLGLQYNLVRQRAEELQRANSDLTKEMAYQQAVLEQALERYGKLADSTEGSATGIEEAATAWKNLHLQIGELANAPFNKIGQGIALIFDLAGAKLRAEMEALENYVRLLQQIPGISSLPFAPGAFVGSSQRRFISDSAGRDVARHSRGRGGAGDGGGYDDEQTAAMVDWVRQREAITRNANNQILSETNQYNQQRAETIRSYEQTIAREARDFATQRLRAEQDHAQAIAEIHEAAQQRETRMAEDLARTIGRAQSDAADRLAEMQEDLDRTIGQRRADSAERIAEWEADRDEAIEERRKDSADRILELEEDFARDRERAQAQFQLSLEEAAARGDARSVYRLQQRHELEQEEAARAHQERVSDEKTKLQEAIDQLNEAHEERVKDEEKALNKAIGQAQEAHKRQVEDQKEALQQRIDDANQAYTDQRNAALAADAQRIEDMNADFTLRRTRENADRLTRLGDLTTDHNNQLAEQNRAHGERIKQINRHASEERDELDEEFKAHLKALNIHIDGYEAAYERVTNFAIEEFNRWLGAIREELAKPVIGPVENPVNDPTFNARRQQLEAQRSELIAEQRAYPPGLGQWSSLQTQINTIEAELKRLGWTPSTTPAPATASASALMANSRFTMPTPAPSIAATGTGGGDVNVSIGQMVLQGANPSDPRAFADDFNRQLLQALRDAKGRV